MKTTFTDQEITDYLTCPKRYQLFHVEGLRRPLPALMMEKEVHREAFLRALRDNMDMKQHEELFWHLHETSRPYTGSRTVSRRGRKRMIRDIKPTLRKTLGVWYLTILPTLAAPPPWEPAEVETFEYDGFEVLWKPDFKIGEKYLYLHAFQNDTKVGKWRWQHPRYMFPFAAHSGAMVDVLGITPFVNNKCVVLGEYRNRRAKNKIMNLMRDVCLAVNEEHFPRTTPESPFCDGYVCEFYHMCTRVLER